METKTVPGIEDKEGTNTTPSVGASSVAGSRRQPSTTTNTNCNIQQPVINGKNGNDLDQSKESHAKNDLLKQDTDCKVDATGNPARTLERKKPQQFKEAETPSYCSRSLPTALPSTRTKGIRESQATTSAAPIALRRKNIETHPDQEKDRVATNFQDDNKSTTSQDKSKRTTNETDCDQKHEQQDSTDSDRRDICKTQTDEMKERRCTPDTPTDRSKPSAAIRSSTGPLSTSICKDKQPIDTDNNKKSSAVESSKDSYIVNNRLNRIKTNSSRSEEQKQDDSSSSPDSSEERLLKPSQLFSNMSSSGLVKSATQPHLFRSAAPAPIATPTTTSNEDKKPIPAGIKGSIAERMAALKRSQEEDWKRRLDKEDFRKKCAEMVDEMPPEIPLVSKDTTNNNEKKRPTSEGVTLRSKSPASDAESKPRPVTLEVRKTLIDINSQKWRERIEDKGLPNTSNQKILETLEINSLKWKERVEDKGLPQDVSLNKVREECQKNAETGWRSRIKAEEKDLPNGVSASKIKEDLLKGIAKEKPSTIPASVELKSSETSGRPVSLHVPVRPGLVKSATGSCLADIIGKRAPPPGGVSIFSPVKPTLPTASSTSPTNAKSNGTTSPPKSPIHDRSDQRKTDGGPPLKVSVPKVDDENFNSFFESPKKKHDKCKSGLLNGHSLKEDVLAITDEALDTVSKEITSNRLLVQKKGIKPPARKSAATKSSNPLKALAARSDFVKDSYEESVTNNLQVPSATAASSFIKELKSRSPSRSPLGSSS